ncbi:MAG: hypothetical protein Q4F49_01285 [Pseudoxanthomonas suwonensis]|nr:hypothetical protein [Pseudoxanthomonas suwonensis]
MTSTRPLTAPGRLLATAGLAAGLGLAMFAAPAPAHAQDPIARVLVDIADVVFRGGDPYYRHGRYSRDDRLVMERDRYGRPVYYRHAPARYRGSPPRGVAHGYWRNGPGARSNTKCNRNGKCKVEYYDPRYDRNGRRR